MLEEVISAICSVMMTILGFYIIKKIIKSDEKLATVKNLLLVLIMSSIVIIIHNMKYSNLYALKVFLINIIIYKFIFNEDFENSIVFTGILTFLIFISELIFSIIYITLLGDINLNTNGIDYIITNCIIIILNIFIINIKFVILNLQKLYAGIVSNKTISNTIFFILLIIGLGSLMYNLTGNFKINLNSITNIIIMVVLFFIVIIFMRNKYNYNKLITKYDSLFNYVQNFEDWIEKEQLNRHEFKNQLAVLRSITKDKNTKKKIDEILKDNIEIEDEVVNQLKKLPKGGIKGLMYYKSAIAQKNKLNLVIDVSINNNSVLNHLNKNDTQTLCKLIGIYYDNAIEAAIETKKKNILIEIYEIKNQTNIVISNTFKKSKKFNSRNEKGVSSKGKGRGNGLYFAKSLLNKNKWIEGKQGIIDRYYIQTLHIKTRK